ncbi:sigma-70 family RNA polymerase sigma factor [Terrarubrum flagellatum]|uniref:sigma-70 family RNA polymerase sigma factor n=1 Tax=Terrirubrum flagellatum TaxID=2895980 RepID=UPI003145283B
MADDIDIAKAIAGCAAGDRKALKSIYDRESPRMLGVAMRLLRRRALAEEAVQDAFVLLWTHAASFNPLKGDGRAWLYAILRHRALNILRGESRLETSEEPIGENEASEEEDPETVVSRLSDAAKLRICLEGLEPDRRNAIVLSYVNGLSHSELAEKLGMPLGTVKSWLRRSLIALRECMG